ncbi:MAG: hypothetical protein CSA15_08085 [Candidatus Delongbacteria bacterium]|nr:MAG: hypothetical protein CSA15_08085 [Candidatus Delongbacteria bacterium]
MKNIFLSISLFFASLMSVSAQSGSAKFTNEFAFDFYHQISQKHENLFFSPYSISLAMAMTYEGAEDKTSQIISEIMHFPKDKSEMRTALNSDRKVLCNSSDKEKYLFKIANAIWAAKDLNLQNEYINIIKKYHNAPIFKYTFGRKFKFEDLANEINTWTEKNTEQKIKDLIKKNDIDISTVMVIVNAVYFKAEWLSKFKKKDTKKDIFYGTKEKVKVDFMSGYKKVKFYKDNMLTAIGMPYHARKSSMYILLPHSIQEFKKIQKSINNNYFDKIIKSSKYSRIKVIIPKFKTESKLYLKNDFVEAGMKLAFTPNANFSGMSKKRNIYIDKIIHQSFIEVDESGTEAAAATAVVMKRETAIPPVQNMEFKADHPFIYLIADNQTGNVLFIGQITNINTNFRESCKNAKSKECDKNKKCNKKQKCNKKEKCCKKEKCDKNKKCEKTKKCNKKQKCNKKKKCCKKKKCNKN